MDLEEYYTTIYKTLSWYGNTKGVDRRAKDHENFIRKSVSPPSSILIAGCGRGQLLKSLIANHYAAVGTEIANSVFSTDLKGFPAFKLWYSELSNRFGKASFEVVVSNDVLEHISNDENKVEKAVADLTAISFNKVLFSVGLSKNEIQIPGIGNWRPHLMVRRAHWWRELFTKYVDFEEEIQTELFFRYFGTKKSE